MSDASTSAPALPPLPAHGQRNGRAAGPPVFLLALLIGLGVHLGVLLLFHFSLVPAQSITTPPLTPYIHFNADSPALHSLATLAQFSPEQTYLSTEKNFSAQALPDVTSPTNLVFESFTVQPAPTEVDFHQPIHTAPVGTGPGDALKPTQWEIVSTFGQVPHAATKLAARGAFVRITPLEPHPQTSTAPHDYVWPPDWSPPTSNGSWQPATFILRFNALGLAGQPVLDPGLDVLSKSNSANDAEVNKFLLEKLRDWFTKNPPLPPGLYEAVVGP